MYLAGRFDGGVGVGKV